MGVKRPRRVVNDSRVLRKTLARRRRIGLTVSDDVVFAWSGIFGHESWSIEEIDEMMASAALAWS